MSGCANRPKLPPWIRVRVNAGSEREEVTGLLTNLRLNTVCVGAHCPNLGECYHKRTATFLIMGQSCTRNCKFCAVPHDAHPGNLEPDEAERLAEAALKLNLRYVVITSVTRDDLPDQGAQAFAEAIRAVRRVLPDSGIEVLTPDFGGEVELLGRVLDAGPTVFNHNVETVERLSADIRSKATYRRSLAVLRAAADYRGGLIPVKSGLMVGLGETDDEVERTMRELRESGVSLLTIGQYLPPSKEHWALERYVTPEQFDSWRRLALDMGFTAAACGPLVRSSYHAGELVRQGGLEKK